MPLYRYLALDQQGSEQSGSIEASDPRMLAAVLRRRALRVVRIEDPAADQRASEEEPDALSLGDLLPVSLKDRVFLFQQLGLLLRSGLTVLQSLDTAGELSRSPRLAKAIRRISNRIRNGSAFSTAMEEEEGIFPTLAIWLIRSAEASGELDSVMGRIAQHLERKAELRRHLITSLIYPFIVVLTSIGVSLFLMLVIIPKFSAFLARTNKLLPPMTQALVDVSNGLIENASFLSLAVLSCVLAFVYAYKTMAGRLVIDRAILFLPVIGSVITKGAMVQLNWSLSILLRSGVTLLSSLRISAEVIENRVIRRAVENTAESILSGKDLSGSLSQHAVIPKEMIRLAAVGERTGTLDEVMKELAMFYDMELQASVKRMSTAIEPILILLVGGLVGFVYIAFFQAVMSLTG